MFWQRKRCHNCGMAVKDDWNFCPKCGFPLKEPQIKMKPLVGGISISITGTSSGPPNISIKKIGDIKEISERMAKEIETQFAGGEMPKRGSTQAKMHAAPKRTFTETIEPEMKIKAAGNEKVFMINLPESVKENDIDIKRLPHSIEIRAYAGNKLYFKIIEVPSSSEIIKKELSDGKLSIYVR